MTGRNYWQKQTADQPLFPDMLWSRPENKRLAGKLLIVGGNAHGFSAAARAYGEAEKAGIGTARVILPDSLRKTVEKIFPEAEYAPSTPSGSFNQQALAELCDLAQWADGVLLAGDFGRNSETAILLEQFIKKYTGQLTVTQDALDYFLNQPELLLRRGQTLMVPTFSQQQKLAAGIFLTPFTSKMDFLHVIEALHNFSEQFATHIIMPHAETIFVATTGQVSTTKPLVDDTIMLASQGATWWLQHPNQTFEALTTSIAE